MSTTFVTLKKNKNIDICKSNLAVEADFFHCGVEEEDEGEGGRQDGVVVEVLPPDACPGNIF